MKQKRTKIDELIKVENFIDYNQKVQIDDKKFEKLMFIYSLAIRELEIKIGIIKDEFRILYNYELIDHIDTRIKTPQSIIDKMKKKNVPITYKNMIEDINDIAGVRVICLSKKDIFYIKDLIKKMPDIDILKEKDYVTYPKKSGYSSYHLIVKVPIALSKNNIYVKVEIQIRTIAMDFWANLEHKMKYKPNKGKETSLFYFL
jgi:putative GTP pyrophosphokinase